MDENGGKSKSLKVGVWGPQKAPGGVQGQCPGGGQGALPLDAEGFFLNLRYEKPHFLALYPVSNSHSQNSLYCALRLFPEEQTRQRQRSILFTVL